MRLAVRAGLVTLDVAVLVGAVMIATGISRALGGEQQAAHTAGGALKPAHAVTMHGVVARARLASRKREWSSIRSPSFAAR